MNHWITILFLCSIMINHIIMWFKIKIFRRESIDKESQINPLLLLLPNFYGFYLSMLVFRQCSVPCRLRSINQWPGYVYFLFSHWFLALLYSPHINSQFTKMIHDHDPFSKTPLCLANKIVISLIHIFQNKILVVPDAPPHSS